jgi:peptide/nickel transport system permease protein
MADRRTDLGAASGVAERELTSESVYEGTPADAVTMTIAAVESGDEGLKKKFGIGAWLAAGWLGLLLFACVFASVLPIPPPEESFSGLPEAPPFEVSGHVLGGDGIGRDMVSRLVYGARNSLFVGVGAIVIGVAIGGFLGLAAGYYRGKLETVIVGAVDVMLSFPALVLALALSIFLRERLQESFSLSPEVAGRLTLTFALGIVAIPALARITRANTLVWSQREFVTAARAQGAKNGRIMVREVLPNVVPAMGAIALLSIAVVIIAEASLSILGAGIPDAPTWGNIIQAGVPDLTNGEAPHVVFEASAVIFLTVLSLNYLGDVVRARFDVREVGV